MASPLAVASTLFGRSKKTPTSTTVCNPFVKTVCLDKWWLIRVERDSKGRRGLGVAGFALREGQEARAFFSAAIAQRHDSVTLETADGITIKINGFINMSDTTKNGFPSEVGNCFRSGFPHNWEEYAGRFCSEESGYGAITSRISNLDGFDSSSVDGTDSSLPFSLNDLPVTLVRDLLMSSGADARVLGKSIMNDIMQHFGGNEATGKKREDDYGTQPIITQNFVQKQVPRDHDKPKGDGKCKDDGNEATGKKRDDDYGTQPMITQNFVQKQVPRDHDKTKGDGKCKDDGSSQHSIDKGKVNFQKIASECEMGIDVSSLSGGVRTRSMSRLSNLRNKQSNNLSPSTYVRRRLTEISRDLCSLTVDTGSGTRKRQKTIVSDADEANDHTLTTKRLSRRESLSEPISKSEVSDNQYRGVLSGEEMKLKQVPDKSAVRRSGRLSKIHH